MSNISLTLWVLPLSLAVCRFDAHSEIPAWATGVPFFSITRTAEELSIVCPEQQVPLDVKSERGWRILKFEGPFDFTQVGILAAVAVPLAKAKISIFAISTYDTDYLLVKEKQLELAISVLVEQGHNVDT